MVGKGGSFLSPRKVSSWRIYPAVYHAMLIRCCPGIWGSLMLLHFWAELTYTDQVEYGNIGGSLGAES